MNVVLAVHQARARLALELALSQEPGVTIVGTVSETEGMLALARTARPDLVRLEWGLPGRPEPDVLAEAQARANSLRFLVLGRDPTLRQRALAADASAFVLIRRPARAAPDGSAAGARFDAEVTSNEEGGKPRAHALMPSWRITRTCQ